MPQAATKHAWRPSTGSGLAGSRHAVATALHAVGGTLRVRRAGLPGAVARAVATEIGGARVAGAARLGLATAIDVADLTGRAGRRRTVRLADLHGVAETARRRRDLADHVAAVGPAFAVGGTGRYGH